MTPYEVGQRLAAEIDADLPFQNHHGITRENLDQFLVEPHEVLVDPDDLETEPRLMWVVLQERPDPAAGYSIVFDPLRDSWGVAERAQGGGATLLISAPTLAAALDGM